MAKILRIYQNKTWRKGLKKLCKDIIALYQKRRRYNCTHTSYCLSKLKPIFFKKKKNSHQSYILNHSCCEKSYIQLLNSSLIL